MDEIPFLRPQMPSSAHIEQYLARAREAHWYSNDGPCAQLLRERLAAYVGGGPLNCVLASSGTLGLMVALRAAVGTQNHARDVLVPSFTYIASVSAILWSGLRPVFLDVAEDHWHLDPGSLAAALDLHAGNVAAVMACSTFGSAPPLPVKRAWEELCEQNAVPLIVDSAAGFGSRDEAGQALGRQGTAEVFSFHATKPFAVGEGGAVFTADEKLADRISALTRFGLDDRRVLMDEPGLNAKMSEVHAATGLAVLDGFKKVLEARATRASAIRAGLTEHGFSFQRGHERSSSQFVAALAPSAEARARVISSSNAAGVQVRIYHPPLHTMAALARYPTAGSLQVTLELAPRMLSLPLANDLTSQEVSRVRAAVLG